MRRLPSTYLSAFTLIELSIVLVIIGLIVGGVLVGKDLISGAGVRAQLSQIEQYNTAVNAFRAKYNCLPGDCLAAANFGFKARDASLPGRGDGNSQLAAFGSWGAQGTNQGAGETALFWTDLSMAGLIDASFSVATANGSPTVTTSSMSDYLPKAKIGGGNYVYVFSNGNTRLNYFAISAVTGIASTLLTTSMPGLTVLQAYSIDYKIDDGIPQTGAVTAQYVNSNIDVEPWPVSNCCFPVWAAGGGVQGANSQPGPSFSEEFASTASTAASATTCYDNNSTNGATQRYSLTQNNGSGLNCGISIRTNF
jgi:prepilin-type N-terminal cleavage/methylation domain-containing protein